MLSQSGGIASAVQNPHDHDRVLVVQIVDGVIARKAHTQARCEILPRGGGKRKMQQWIAILFDPVDQARRCRLGSFAGDIEPDFGKVGFRRLGQAEGERSANSFLPRSTMRAASKSLTRPAATSARPASMSAFKAVSSSI